MVRGQYQYPLGGGAYSSPIDVEYKFYLGGDLVTDYNIYRDYHYKLTVNIAGPNSADLRVTITNGNVAVFDDVTMSRIPLILVEEKIVSILRAVQECLDESTLAFLHELF